jgi:branched-chain amino acid aminotransferase
MSEKQGERVAYFNGEIVPESQVLLPFRDRGFLYGDAAFDMTRTFGHRIFKLKEHLDRFYDSLRYIQIDPGLSPEALFDISEKVLERNLPLLGPEDDYWVGQRVSRGLWDLENHSGPRPGPTVIVECAPLPLKSRAPLYRNGIDVVVPSVRRVPPECLSPRVKSHNYLNLIMGDMEAKAANPDAWAVLLDLHGNITEGIGCNIFLVDDGRLFTPKAQFVLGGVSRNTAIELAAGLDIPVIEKDLDLFDVHNADEVFLTSTSLCICGVRSVNGQKIADGRPPGPMTQRLIDAYVKLVDCNYVAQYLRHLNES